MEQVNNKEEIIKSMLKDVKLYLKKMIKFDDQRGQIVDEKMLEILKKQISDVENLDRKVMFEKVILMYAAIYFDNVELFEMMHREGINFGSISQEIQVYLLDREITSKCSNEEYVEVVKKWQLQFKSFYDSTKELDEKERQKYIDRFVNLIKKLNVEGNVKMPFHLFNKHALDNYQDDTYLLASVGQLVAICTAPWAYYINKGNDRETSLERLNHLIQTTDFDKSFVNFDVMFDLFTDEELQDLGWAESCFFDVLSDTEEMRKKALDLYRRCPELVKKFGWLVNPTAIRTIDNDILIEMNKNNINLGLGIDCLKPLSNLYKPKVLVKKIFNKKQQNG